MKKPAKISRDKILSELVAVLESNAKTLEKSVGSNALKKQAKTLRETIEHLKSHYFGLSFSKNDLISLGAIIEISDGREYLVTNSKIDVSASISLSLPIAMMDIDYLKSNKCAKVGDSYSYSVGRPGEQQQVNVSIVNIR